MLVVGRAWCMECTLRDDGFIEGFHKPLLLTARIRGKQTETGEVTAMRRVDSIHPKRCYGSPRNYEDNQLVVAAAPECGAPFRFVFLVSFFKVAAQTMTKAKTCVVADVLSLHEFHNFDSRSGAGALLFQYIATGVYVLSMAENNKVIKKI